MQSEVIDLLDMADGAGGGLPPPAGAMGGGGAERGGAPRSPSPLPVVGASSSLHGAPSLTPPRGEVACCLRKLSVRCLRLRDAEGVPLGLPCGGAGSHFACAACLEKYVGERPGRTIVCEGCLQASGVQAPYSIGGLAALVDALASRLRVEQRPLLQPLPPGSLDYAFAAHLFFSGGQSLRANEIVRIEAVTSPRLWREYASRRQLIAVRLPQRIDRS